jgi:hypothetical protein
MKTYELEDITEENNMRSDDLMIKRKHKSSTDINNLKSNLEKAIDIKYPSKRATCRIEKPEKYKNFNLENIQNSEVDVTFENIQNIQQYNNDEINEELLKEKKFRKLFTAKGKFASLVKNKCKICLKSS